MPSIDHDLDRRIEEWKHRLIDLTRRNRLLYFKPSKSSTLKISTPQVETLFQRIYLDEGTLKFWIPPEEESGDWNEMAVLSSEIAGSNARPGKAPLGKLKVDEIVCEQVGRRQLEKILKNIHRRSRTDYQERGVRILHLALGTLSWKETAESDTPIASPLVLCPVELVYKPTEETFELHWAEEDPVSNPALATKLRLDFKLELPGFSPDEDGMELSSYFQEVQEVVVQRGWKVEPSIFLDMFSFHKLAMFDDLKRNLVRIKSHPIIRGLAGEPIKDSGKQPIPEMKELDHIQTPESTYQILDADSSQQQCIQGVLRGHNIILHGPPGTGKSQTIANIIAEFIARGRTVLFVSEKMAALEVVFNRLRNVGLGDFCLELHSHKANKRDVTRTLKQSLDNRLHPTHLPTQDEFARFTNSRNQLNSYISALHMVRTPLDKSVCEVLGLLVKLRSAPFIATRINEVIKLSPPLLVKWEDFIQRMARVWHVTLAGNEFIWFGCQDEQYDAEARMKWLRRLEDCVHQVEDLVAIAKQLSSEIGVSETADLAGCKWLFDVGFHLNYSPSPHVGWFAHLKPNEILEEAKAYRASCAEYRKGCEELATQYSDDFHGLAVGTGNRLGELWSALTDPSPKGVCGLDGSDPSGRNLCDHRQSVLTFLRITETLVQEINCDAEYLANAFGLEIKVISGWQAAQLTKLAVFSVNDAKPEAMWFDPIVLRQVRETVVRLKPGYDAYSAKRREYIHRRTKILERYDDAFLDLDLNEMIVRFGSFPYRTILRFIWPGFSRDKRTILQTSRSAALSQTVLDDLIEAREIVRLRNYLASNQPAPCSIFGRYDQQADTDFNKLNRALEMAESVLQIVGQVSAVTPEIVRLLGAGSLPTANLVGVGERITQNLNHFQKVLDPVRAIVPYESLPQSKAGLIDSPVLMVQSWLNLVTPQFAEFTEIIDRILSLCRNIPGFTIPNAIAALGRKDQLGTFLSALQAESELLRNKFGARYAGIETNWEDVLKAVEWTIETYRLFDSRTFPKHFVDRAVRGVRAGPSVAALSKQFESARTALAEVMRGFEAPGVVVRGQLLVDLPLAEMAVHLKSMMAELPQLELWTDLRNLNRLIKGSWIEVFLAEAKQLRLQPAQLVPTAQRTIFESWVEAIRNGDVSLSEFRSRDHERVIQSFCEMDAILIRLAAQRVVAECENRRPQGVRLQSQDSETATLRREANKQRRHLPVRALFDAIPNLVMKLKPCLLMSPLSVSQFLQTERIKFDLVIFDEASQIFTEDAIGAITRGAQLVIAGDSRQLPPTDFFRRINGDDDEENLEESEIDSSANYASVLDEFQTIEGIAGQDLRWHYRSRHESLIAFSNNQFYNNRLVTFPSAMDKNPEMGVEFVYVKDGIYDRGGKRHNLREAQVVADRVFDHAKRFPKKSLIVVTFSQAQQQAIEDELEQRRRQNPIFEEFFREDRLEGFDVKNLENVQGDERDVVIFSVGYGKDASGFMTMGFGPLNRNGGERRLNVAVTRARRKVILVSSIAAADIKVSAATPAGVRNLQRYLDYAERGPAALSLTHPQGMGEAESLLEEDVASAIRSLGFDVVPQVGCSGYRIDIGIIDPAYPGHFLLGVEADGATYHSAHTARDRDRLRQQVLENLGWTIHRIWSFDWERNRENEIERLRKVIQLSRLSWQPPQEESVEIPAITEYPMVQVAERLPNEDGVILPGTTNYVPCVLPVPIKRHVEFHVDECRDEQTDLLEQVVMEEGPIHIDLAARRLAEAWGLEKVGSRMKNAVEYCISQLVQKKTVIRRGDFLYPASFSVDTLQIRTPFEGQPESLRKIEHIASEEIRKAMCLFVEHAVSLSRESLIAETRRLFGFNRTGGMIQQRLQDEIDRLLYDKLLVEHENKLANCTQPSKNQN